MLLYMSSLGKSNILKNGQARVEYKLMVGVVFWGNSGVKQIRLNFGGVENNGRSRWFKKGDSPYWTPNKSLEA